MSTASFQEWTHHFYFYPFLSMQWLRPLPDPSRSLQAGVRVLSSAQATEEVKQLAAAGNIVPSPEYRNSWKL